MYILHLMRIKKHLYKTKYLRYHESIENIKKVCVIMILPVNALTPKVSFRGDESKELAKTKTKRRMALFNATGISVILGAATTAIARSNTSSWRHASYFGIGASLISMMFLVPGFMYKAGIGIKSKKHVDKDVFAHEIDMPKKLGDISTGAKTTTKATIKSMSKI